MDEEINRWFDFVEDYYSQSTTPLSYVLCPSPTNTGLRQPGTAMFYKGTRRQWNNLIK